MKTFSCFLLVAFLGIVWAHPSQLPRSCSLDDNGVKALVSCIKEKSGTEMTTKLNAVGKVLHCGEDVECGIKKVCTEFNGSLEQGAQGVLLKEDLEKIRQIFNVCLDKQ
ncbi:uncharacterized protein LOC119452860 [Dermacentor silvarum]|uniref:uncharacterized protein LOC119452860 n=1 Tax=Dermacentor silvarum TaxID=543639 RepID=UPI001897A311|nr:uncharacterized protein LOC119452860 [Dermacentor silvarum]